MPEKMPAWVIQANKNYVPKPQVEKVEVVPQVGDIVSLHYVSCAMPMHVDVKLVEIKEHRTLARYFAKAEYQDQVFSIDAAKPHFQDETWIFTYHEEEIQASHFLPSKD